LFDGDGLTFYMINKMGVPRLCRGGRPSGLAFGSGCHGPSMPDGEGRAAPHSSDGLQSCLMRGTQISCRNSFVNFVDRRSNKYIPLIKGDTAGGGGG
jgi:hypothetical protein